MANNRVYYAIQQVAFSDNEGTSDFTAAHGVQSVGITTTFNLEQAFELGQLALYENVEGVPDVEVTCSKVLDGYIPLFCLATADQTLLTFMGPELGRRALAKCKLQLGIWDESNESAGQNASTAGTWVEMSGLQISSVGYNFPLDDWFSEDITLVGNYKAWGAGQALNGVHCGFEYQPGAVSGGFPLNDDIPEASGDRGGVNKRENLAFSLVSPSVDQTRFPTDIPGIGENGGMGTAKVASISVSCDVGREDIFALGSLEPYAKTVTWPVEVSSDFELTTASGDLINAFDACNPLSGCITKANTSEQKIRVATCEGLRLYLGKKSRLASVSYGGGDAGGGNAMVTYSYTTFNDFTVIHEGDVAASGGSPSGELWWSGRSSYLDT
jgi:hypothetical protein|tara:strand:+ start:18164 stop:19315 length:1152 start_codon:yes stop_codon:yes gene_type:complete